MAILTTTQNGLSFAGGTTFIQTGASSLMSIKTDGNVGIGTTNPTRKLQVDSAAGYTLSLNSTQQYLMEFARDGVSEWWFAVNNGDFKFHENGVGDQVIIKAGGNVGIGATAFNNYWSGYTVLKLGADNGFFSNTASGAGSALFIAQNVYNDGSIYRHIIENQSGLVDMRDGKFSFLTSPSGAAGAAATMTNRFTILQAGNVGIGETAPKAPLNITGVSLNPVVPTAASSSGILRIESGNGGVSLDIGSQGSAPYSMWMQVGNTSNNTGDVYPILLNPLGGNVGIGTTSPDFKLDVEGSVNNADIGIRINNTFDDDLATSNPNAALFLGAASNNGYLRVHGAPANTAAKHQIDLGSTAGDSFLTFSPNGAERMRINSVGGIKFNNYGAGYLQTDASGNITSGAVTTSDTLDDVTDNGNTTTNSITVGGVTSGGLISTGDNEFRGDTYLRNGGDDGAGARVGDIWYSVGTTGSPAPVGVYESAVITTVKNGTHGRSDIVFKTKDNDTANFGTTSERMRINSQGQTWLGGSFTGANIANGSASYLNNLNAGGFSVLHRNAADVYLHFNSYFTSSGTYISKYEARSGFRIDAPGDSNGGLNFFKAPAVAVGAVQTFSEVMRMGYGTYNNVGIGVSAPSQKLHVAGNARVTGAYYDSNNSAGTAGQILSSTATGTDWIAAPSAGSTVYTPDVFEITTNQSITSQGTLLSMSGTQIIDGSTGATIPSGGGNTITATQNGVYEISYTMYLETTHNVRQIIGAYIEKTPSGSQPSQLAGSFSSVYMRVGGSNQGFAGTITNTFYAVLAANDAIKIRMGRTDSNTSPTGISIQVPDYPTSGVKHVISLRKINAAS